MKYRTSEWSMPAILSSVVWAISPASDVAEFAPFMADSLVPVASLNCETKIPANENSIYVTRLKECWRSGKFW